MSALELPLVAHPDQPTPAGVRVCCALARDGDALSCAWRLADPRGAVALPPAAARPERRFALWEATCFELFVAGEGLAGYWELNLSPAGDWNLFRLEGYRRGLVEEPRITSLQATIEPRSDMVVARVRLDLAPLGLAGRPWRLAASTVVVTRDGATSFWALAHPGLEPDFHHPDAFTVTRLPAEPVP